MKDILKRLVPEGLRRRTYPAREAAGRAAVNAAAGLRIWWRLRVRRQPIADLATFERKFHSQNWEDGIIEAIFAAIGTTNRYFVEFGVEDGTVCNSRRLLELGWTGLQMDGREAGSDPVRKQEFIRAENINDLFRKYSVPAEFDLLSIDIDGNDYWVWKAIAGYRPRVVVMEYNSSVPASESRTVPYDTDFRWDGTEYFGASLLALAKLGREKGYTLVGCDSNGINAFFVQDALVPGRFLTKPPVELYRPLGPEHGVRPRSDRPWVTV